VNLVRAALAPGAVRLAFFRYVDHYLYLDAFKTREMATKEHINVSERIVPSPPRRDVSGRDTER
jgi:hypothetical protein